MIKIKSLFFLLLSLNCVAENYFVEAGKKYGIDPQLLWAIAKTESQLNPNALNQNNKNGSYDIGIMQINSIHLNELWTKYGISEDDLYNPRLNIHIGAKILKDCLNKYDNNLINGITCYNGRIENNPYGEKVLDNLMQARRKYQ
ncbi:lytic transglycosylase domain-containing protein [Helicobacter colisuis]|uniref:lytic transglycosylase domain-containing protein n=1 Tax=Helicobacter colisuis TaxID=2949739 RepID=UPI00202A1E36|nr:lytic transglycosylase domain-containing protein [Helicobacter colisuis]MCL9823388.1 lytic transglycosylase domain-containing protein [Helicobacter colisuis]